MSVVQISGLVVLAALVIAIALGSRRRRLGDPFVRRPAALVFIVVALIVAGLCLLLAMRHGG